MRAEAEHGLTDLAMNSSRYHGDETLLVRFFKHPMRNQARSLAEGRPIFEDTDYIEIMQPGNKDSIIRRPASDRDKQRFAEHFRKYQARETEESIEGTPLEEWPAVSRAQVEELKFLNIRTVEQLAALADSNAQNIMGVQGLKSKAAAYLEASKESAAAEALAAARAENEQIRKEMEEMREIMKSTPKRGRPRKADAEATAED